MVSRETLWAEEFMQQRLREAEQALPRAMRRKVNPESIELLRSYDWPGNIRELRSCIYNGVFSYPDVEHLQPRHLQLFQSRSRSRSGAHDAGVPEKTSTLDVGADLWGAFHRTKHNRRSCRTPTSPRDRGGRAEPLAPITPAAGRRIRRRSKCRGPRHTGNPRGPSRSAHS